LGRNGSTYAETFYNFKRSKLRIDKKNGGYTKAPLKIGDILVTLVFETVVPYVKLRL
jgi:hypothetical protein